MDLTEKSLELNITHELLSLTERWNFEFSRLSNNEDIKCLKSERLQQKVVAGALSLFKEGKSDKTGEAGGGYDVKIEIPSNGYMLFIQYKKGHLSTENGTRNSPKDYLKFEINKESNNQFFLLKELSENVKKKGGNAVVYAFPMIKNHQEMVENGGSLLSKTKFVTIGAIQEQANKDKIGINPNQDHCFLINVKDWNKCEVHSEPFAFEEKDVTGDILKELILLNIVNSFLSFRAPVRHINRVDELKNEFFNCLARYVKFIISKFDLNANPFQRDLNRIFHSRLQSYEEFFELNSLRNNLEENGDLDQDRRIAIVKEILKGLNSIIKILIGDKQIHDIKLSYFFKARDINFRSENHTEDSIHEIGYLFISSLFADHKYRWWIQARI